MRKPLGCSVCWQGRRVDSESQLSARIGQKEHFPLMKRLLQASEEKKLCRKERVLQLGIDASAVYARVLCTSRRRATRLLFTVVRKHSFLGRHALFTSSAPGGGKRGKSDSVSAAWEISAIGLRLTSPSLWVWQDSAAEVVAVAVCSAAWSWSWSCVEVAVAAVALLAEAEAGAECES